MLDILTLRKTLFIFQLPTLKSITQIYLKTMATERKKFKIPTADEVQDSSEASALNSFNKFQQLKKEGKVTDARDLDKSIRTDKQSTSSSRQHMPSTSVNQSKNLLPPRTSSSTSSLSLSDNASKKMEIGKPSNPSAPEPSIPTAVKSLNTNSLIVNSRQRGNPILKFIRSIPYEFGDIIPDYEMGKTACALFLSLRYHQLNPNYIHERLKQLRRYYDLRVLLVQVDIKEPHHLVKELAKICILAECTLILAFSAEEAGRYLETYKVYEHKPPDAIMEKTEKDYMSKVTECLTSVRSVNKTDAMTLLSTFHTVEGVLKANQEDLSFCPGFGPQKAKRAFDLFNEPFLKSKKKK